MSPPTSSQILPIILHYSAMLEHTYYSQNYASIIGQGLHLRQVAQTSAELTPGKSMEATPPELGPVDFWSLKSSSFSGSDSIVVEEAARNF